MKGDELSEGERHRLLALLETSGTTDRQLRSHMKAQGGWRKVLAALLRSAESSSEESTVLLRDALELVEQYHAQWGAENLARKWGLPEEREKLRAAVAELGRAK